jgi:hypothetical protein
MNTEIQQTADLQHIASLESTIDTVACELLDHLTEETAYLWAAFSNAMQADLKAKFGDAFESF